MFIAEVVNCDIIDDTKPPITYAYYRDVKKAFAPENAPTYIDKSKLKSTKSDEDKDLADELADVMFVVICLANQTGIDLTKALQKNIRKKTMRDTDRHRSNDKLK